MIRKFRRVHVHLALALVLTLLSSACAGGGAKPSSTPSPSSSTVPAATKPFIFAVNRPSENLDPVTQDANSDIWVFMNIYQQLIRLNVKGDAFEPDLAEKWDVSPDGKVYTFHLNKNAKFSSGNPVTSKDVVFSLTRARDTKGPWKWALEAVDKIEARDANTVVITLKEPWAPFLSDISLFSNSILEEAYFKGASQEKLSNQPMGSGPYYLAEWKKGERIVLKANPHYHGGPVKTPEIHLVYIPDDDTRIIKLQSGEVNGIDAPPFSRVAELKANPNIDMQLNPSTQVSHLALNNKEGPTANKKFRQALAYATDRPGIIKAVLFGNGTVANSFLPQTTLYYNPSLKGYDLNLDKARALMTEAGVPAGTKLKILFRSGNQVQLQTATAIKEMWGKIGVDVELEPLDPAAATARYRKNDFQVYVTGWTNDIPDPSQLSSYELGFTESQSYHTQYQNKEIDALLAQGLREMNPDKRRQIYYKIQDIAHEDSPLIWLYYAPYTLALSKKVQGFAQMATGPWVFKNVSVQP